MNNKMQAPSLPLFGNRITSYVNRNAASYFMALVLVLAAQFGTSILLPVTKNTLFLLFCTAIAVSAIRGGAGPGLFATALSAAFTAYYYLPPDRSFAVDSAGVLKLDLLIGAGALITGQCERLHRARRAADQRWKEIEEAQQRRELLTQIGGPLTAATPLQLSLQNVALILTRHFADLCLIDALREDGELQRVGVSVSNLMDKDFAEQIALRYPLEAALHYGPPEVVRAGQGEVARRLDLETTHHQILESAGFHAFLSLPLYAPGRRLGVVTLAFATSRTELRPEDLTFATEITRMIAIRVANESLLWTAQKEIDRLKRQIAAA